MLAIVVHSTLSDVECFQPVQQASLCARLLIHFDSLVFRWYLGDGKRGNMLTLLRGHWSVLTVGWGSAVCSFPDVRTSYYFFTKDDESRSLVG